MTSAQQDRRLLMVGYRGGTHVGSSLARAASAFGISVRFFDARRAFAGPGWLRVVNWRLRGHRPMYLRRFSKDVATISAEWRPNWLLTTGLAPVDAETLAHIGAMGVRTLNYLTDDPWNSTMRSDWFFDALLQYDAVYSVRRANLKDLGDHGCRAVAYLPFGYDPALWFPDPIDAEGNHDPPDVLYAGGADPDRAPYITALIRAGFAVAVYGGYWERYSETRLASRGLADPDTLRRATSRARVLLCLVRRANRDGHVMRSFEIPAAGGCMLAEDTIEHREIFGPDGEAVTYFRTVSEMITKLRWLLAHDSERHRLATAAHRLVVEGNHTYHHRLQAMLGGRPFHA